MNSYALPSLPAKEISHRGSSINRPLLLWQIRQAVNLVAASSFSGMMYSFFADGFTSILPYINGFIVGLVGGVCLCLGEMIVFRTIRKRVAVINVVAFKSIAYTVTITITIFTVILVSRSIQFGLTIRETFYSEAFQHLLYHEDFIIMIIYALGFIAILVFTREMSHKMGQGVLFDFIIGRYAKPKIEKRIFMFLDMKASASRAERLGDLEYHNLLSDFFGHITECILTARGKIHHYVGDEVVVSWPFKASLRTENCLQAYFGSVKKMQSLEGYYLSRYGIVPHFKAAFHCGDVICGEIGEVKSEIVFHGDVVNTTSRLERMCSELDENVLISKLLFDTFPAQVQQLFSSAGQIKLRGKEQAMEAFSLRPATLPI